MNSVVITGSGTGLGRELALQYSKANHHIILLGRTLHHLKETKQLIENNGHSASIVVCDLQSVSDIQRAVTTITSSHTVNILINNSGIGYFDTLEQMDDDEIQAMINTNVLGTIYLTKYFLTHLKSNDTARILNIISTAGLRGKVNEAVYCASKFAIRGFTEALQKELEDSSVKVTGVYMGGMDTPFWNNSSHILDKSRLRSPASVAKQIFEEDKGNLEILIN